MPRGRKKKKNTSPDLTPLELTFMRIIWENGNATAAEIREALNSEKPLADTTIHTVLANMRKKGVIEPIPTVERALRFAPLVSREKVAGRSLKQLLIDFFEGSPKRLMAHMLKEEKLDEREMKEIRRLIRKPDPKGGKKNV